MGKKILICGSRTYCDKEKVEALIRELPAGTTIIHGNAKGADRIADTLARKYHLEVKRYPADWKTYKSAAGPIRNQLMLDKEDPDEVHAFVDKPLKESRGTADMVRRAIKARKKITIYDDATLLGLEGIHLPT